jgi:dethiobiotin synthetase
MHRVHKDFLSKADPSPVPVLYINKKRSDMLARIIFTRLRITDKNMRMGTLFVAGTDTGVGKTYFCAHFLQYLLDNDLDAGYQKWVSTGDAEHSADLDYCLQTAGLANSAVDINLQVPCRFAYSASPHLAAEIEGRPVDVEVIIDSFRKMAEIFHLLIVEGVGGLLVPLRRDLFLVDLLARLQPPVLLIARSGLGTLNHTLLSLEALRRRNIPVLGVVFSDSEEQSDPTLIADNIKTIEELGDIKVFGRLPRVDRGADPLLATKNFLGVGNAVFKAWQRI